jgi:hypothetical protein
MPLFGALIARPPPFLEILPLPFWRAYRIRLRQSFKGFNRIHGESAYLKESAPGFFRFISGEHTHLLWGKRPKPGQSLLLRREFT